MRVGVRSLAFAGLVGGCTLTQSLDDLSGTASELDGSKPSADVGAGGGSWPSTDANADTDASPDVELEAASDAAIDEGGGPIGCGAGQKLCDSSCVALDDALHGCGSASCTPCTIAHGTASCSAGACAIAACEAGFGDCNGSASDGCETDLASNPNHCGGCGKSCFVANATTGCSNGSCYWTGAPPFADCDGNLATGCEQNLSFCTCYVSCPGCVTCCVSPTTCLQCYC